MVKRQPAECGTNAGYFRHYRAKEKPCEPCRKAHSADARRRYLASQDERQAALRARSKAHGRLAQQFQVEYLELLVEEMEAEGLDSTRVQNRAWKAALQAAEEET